MTEQGEQRPIRVFLVDAQPAMEVAGEAGDGREALDEYAHAALRTGASGLLLQVAGPADDPRLAPLTAREVEVVALVGQGRTHGEIAGGLFPAEATVKAHIGRILHKCALHDRVQMVLLAHDTGLVGRARP